jgi:hypothetical protein
VISIKERFVGWLFGLVMLIASLALLSNIEPIGIKRMRIRQERFHRSGRVDHKGSGGGNVRPSHGVVAEARE